MLHAEPWYLWLETGNSFVSPCASCRKDQRCLLKQAGYTSDYEIPSHYKTNLSWLLPVAQTGLDSMQGQLSDENLKENPKLNSLISLQLRP